MRFTNQRGRICILFILLLQQAFSQTLDTTYGNGVGYTISNIGLISQSGILANNSVILQSYVSYRKFVKFDDQGNQDMAFGTAGSLSPYDQTNTQAASNFKIDSQQRILIWMYEFVNNVHSIKLKRYLQDGTPDTSFGTAGVFVYTTPVQCNMSLSFFNDHSALLVLTQQGISIENRPSLLVKLTPDGSLDPTFGTNGTVNVYQGPNYLQYSTRVTIDGDDNIYMDSRTGPPYNHFLFKFNRFGVPDQTFGAIQVDAMTGYLAATGWFYNGKIYLAAIPSSAPDTLKMIRLNLDGSLDTGFNSINIDQANYQVRPENIAIDHFGKIIDVGMVKNDAGVAQRAIMRCYNADGTVDTTFGSLGEVSFDYNWTNFSYPIIQSDNKIVVAGITANAGLTGNNNWNVILLRYTTNNLSVHEPKPSPIALVPNPASTVFTIAPDTSEKIELYDVQGRLIRTYPGKSGSYSLDGLENNVYILRVFSDSGISVKKLLKN